MNAPHLHLMMNHLPVLGTAFGFGLLAFALWRKSDELRKTALIVFVFAAISAIPVFLSGEPAEDVIESLPGVSKALIEDHEESAAVAFSGSLTLGLFALAGLILGRRGRVMPVWLSYGLLTGALIVSGLMAWTANRGGQVRHTEIRPEAAPSAAPAMPRHSAE